jgi:phage I-like protein
MRFFTALLAATLPLLSSGQAQLLPAGEFAARDGRPGPGKHWKLSDAQGQLLATQLTAVAARTPVVIDYEHQTLNAPKNGQAAPAAGWIKGATWRPGEGLFAEVEWTAAARAHIDAGEYRFISPVITYDAAGRVTGVALAALTNFPAILGMDAVVAALNTQLNHQEPDMDLLAALIASLGLAAGTTQDVALAALTTRLAELNTLKARPALPAALVTELGLQAGADEAAALTALATLKTGAGKVDPTTLTLITTLQGQVAALTAQMAEGGLTGLVDGAIQAQKFAPAMRESLLALGRKDMAALTAIVGTAPVIPGLAGQSGGREFENTAALTADAAKLQSAFGLTADRWAKAGKA